MRFLLALIFMGIFAVMLIATVNASLVRPVWDNSELLDDP